MPQIKQFEAPEGIGLRPTETGINAVAGAARRVQSNYNEAAQDLTSTGQRFASTIRDAGDVATKYIDHQQISAGAAHGAQLFDSLTESRDAAIKGIDPNDPAYGQKVEIAVKQWREGQLEPSLEKFREGFVTENGQKFAEHYIETTRNHMFLSSSADISNAAAVGIHNAIRTTVNTASNTVMRDPSSLQTQLDLLDHSVTGLVESSPIKGVASAKVRSDVLENGEKTIAHAAAVGAIQKSNEPEKTAAEFGAKYPKYFNATELQQLGAAARRESSYRRTDENAARVNQDRIRTEASEGRRAQYIQDLYSDDPKVAANVTAKAISRDPYLKVQDAEHLIGIVKRELKPETDAKISNRNYIEVLKGIRTGQISDTDPIFKAREDGRLDKADFNQAMKDFSEYKSPQGEALSKDRAEFFKRYAPAIDPSMSDTASPSFGHFSALGSQKMYEAEKAARRAEEDLRKAGKDPHLAYDPSSPEFFGKQLGKFRASLQDATDYQATISKNDRKAAAPDFKPPSDWQWSPSRKQYRDPQSGKIYDQNGKAAP